MMEQVVVDSTHRTEIPRCSQDDQRAAAVDEIVARRGIFTTTQGQRNRRRIKHAIASHHGVTSMNFYADTKTGFRYGR